MQHRFTSKFAPVTPSLVELLYEEQGEDDEDDGDGDLEAPEGDGDMVEAIGAAVALKLEVDPARQDVHPSVMSVHHGQVPCALHHMRK